MTVAGIAIVAYCLSNFVHEGVGHGYACILAGSKPKVLNAVYFECEESELSLTGKRILAAGGSVANLILAVLALIALKLRKGVLGPTHYFLWLLMSLNFLMPFGYLLFSGLGGFGDWAVVVEGLRPTLLWRAILSIAGAFLYFILAPRLIMPGLNPYLGQGIAERRKRARLVSLAPYLVGGVTFVVAGFLNPESIVLVLVSAAAASFGGTSLLAWFPGVADERFRESAPTRPADIPRSVPWIAAGAVTLVLFVGVLGPGIKF
jgi:hypothetical protein